MRGERLKRNVVQALELPKEVMLNLPLLSMTGREEVVLENYKGIVEYCEEVIRISTAVGVIRMTGKDLFLKQLTAECLVVTGKIETIGFLT